MRSLKRIAIVGAHGVGKTTLAKKISEELGLFLIPEVARDLIKAVNFNWRGEDKDSIYYFEKAILYTHVFYVNSINEFIADRSIFDVFAYTLWHYKRFKDGRFKSLLREINKIANHVNYSKIFLFKNGYNEKDECGAFVEFVIEEKLKSNNIDYMIINKGDLLVMEGKRIVI